MPFKVFISHSTADARQVEQLHLLLTASRIESYVCSHDHQAGRSLAEKLQAAIDRSDAVIVILTESSATSTYVAQEIGWALKGGKLVIPLVDQRIAAELDLGMLQGVEQIRFDPADPIPAVAMVLERCRPNTSKVQGQGQSDLVKLVMLAVLAAGLLYVATSPIGRQAG